MQVGSAVLVVFALAALVDAEDRMRYGDYDYDQTSVDSQYGQVRDVFVYDSEGRLVENARLFDQNGNPIRLGYPDCWTAALRDGDPLLRPYPYCPEQAPFGPRAPGAPTPARATDAARRTPTSTPDPTGTPDPTRHAPSRPERRCRPARSPACRRAERRPPPRRADRRCELDHAGEAGK